MRKMKRVIAAALPFAMLAGLAAVPASAEEVKSTPDWEAYDELIASARVETDTEKRDEMLHEAETMLMDTGAAIPVYYYNDVYMKSSSVDGIYTDLLNTKYFMYATGTDVLRIQLGSEPTTTDPQLVSASDLISFVTQTFVGLLTKDETGEIVPALAADMPEVSEDGLTYTFTLKEDLKWSDGTPLTAADFVYSWNRAADPDVAADYQNFFTDYIAVKDDGTLDVTASEDGQTLTVKLQAPCGYFLDLVAFPTYRPVPQTGVESADGWETNPGAWATEAGYVSNGAYTLTEWKHGESMVLTKNLYFYNADQVSVETIEVMLTDDDVAAYSAFNSGDLDFCDSIPVDEIPSAMESEEFYKEDSLGPYYISFSVTSDMFAGKTAEQASAMRKAIGLLLDREWMVEKCAQGGQTPANTFVPKSMYSTEYEYPVEDETYGAGYFSITDLEGNTEEAIELLKSAGYEFDEDGMLSDSTPLTLHYLTNESTGHIAIAEAMQQDLAVVGIDMTIDVEDWNVFLEDRKNGNYDVARNGWTADYVDPINLLEIFTSTSNNNSCQLGQ